MVWKNINFVKGVKEDKGFSVYRKKSENLVESKHYVIFDRLDKRPQNNQLVYKKPSLNLLLLEFDKNKTLELEYLLINFEESLIKKAKDLGFIFEIRKNVFQKV